MFGAAGNVSVFRILLAAFCLLPLQLSALDLTPEQKQAFEKTAASGLSDPATFRASAPGSRNLNDWLWLDRRGEFVDQVRVQLADIGKRRIALVAQLNLCQRTSCPDSEFVSLTEQLVLQLELQAGATGDDFEKMLEMQAEPLRQQAERLLDSEVSTNFPLKFNLARALLMSANRVGDLRCRLKAVLAIEKTNRSLNESKNLRPGLPTLVAHFEASLEAYESTVERSWLEHANEIGLLIARSTPIVLETVTPLQLIERAARIRLVSALVRMSDVSGRGQYRQQAETLMQELLKEVPAPDPVQAAGLLADNIRLTKQPLHITIVSPKSDPVGRELFEQALRVSSFHRSIEWWDRAESTRPLSDIRYPELKRPAAFVCVEKRCSLPIFDPAGLNAMVLEMGA